MNSTKNLLEAIAKISAKYTPDKTNRLNLMKIFGVEADERKNLPPAV